MLGQHPVVRKAVIPAAGWGTGLLPLSKAVPKEMLPVYDKPVIQHVVNEAVAAGITEIILVTRQGKSAINDHFDDHAELERLLEQRQQPGLLQLVHDIVPASVDVVSVRQRHAAGLGDAVLCARQLVDDEPFVVLLPDMLCHPYQPEADLSRMISRWKATGLPQILVGEMPEAELHRYGVADLNGALPRDGQSVAVQGLVEKPGPGAAPSSCVVLGRYLLPPAVFPLLAGLKPGARGEVQLTDALTDLAGLEACFTALGMIDCGTVDGLLEANLLYGQAAGVLDGLLARIGTQSGSPGHES